VIEIPREPEPGSALDVASLAERLYRFASEVITYMLRVPEIELKTFSTVGHYPIYVDTEIDDVAGVTCVRAYRVDGGGGIAASGVSWAESDDTLQPGIRVDAIDGVTAAAGTAGNEIAVTLMIVGQVNS